MNSLEFSLKLPFNLHENSVLFTMSPSSVTHLLPRFSMGCKRALYDIEVCFGEVRLVLQKAFRPLYLLFLFDASSSFSCKIFHAFPVEAESKLYATLKFISERFGWSSTKHFANFGFFLDGKSVRMLQSSLSSVISIVAFRSVTLFFLYDFFAFPVVAESRKLS